MNSQYGYGQYPSTAQFNPQMAQSGYNQYQGQMMPSQAGYGNPYQGQKMPSQAGYGNPYQGQQMMAQGGYNPYQMSPYGSFQASQSAISPLETQLLQNYFQDVAGIDNRIDPNEFSIMFQSLYPQLGPNVNQYAGQFFNTLDRNRDGAITFDEFMQGYQMLKAGQSSGYM